MNPIEISLNGPCDNKTHSRADICCKWTPLTLEGENFVSTTFSIPDGSPLQVTFCVVENLLARVLIPIRVQTEDFANLFVTLKISKTLDERESRSLDDFPD